MPPVRSIFEHGYTAAHVRLRPNLDILFIPALDQFFTMRPLLDWARYRTPIQNLYLCGSGTHPGVGLTGGSGANAAREILKELKK